MKIRNILLILYFLGCSFFMDAQDFKDYALKDRFLRIMFYNVENLFDTENDSLTNDEEFLPTGERHWTAPRYWSKLQHISSVVAALGGWQAPEIIGLCEIENRKVLEDLCFKSSLSYLKYKIIHKESSDARGVDVALLYQPRSFKPLEYKSLNVYFPWNPSHRTRDILYVKGVTKNDDTLFVFVNHWPSRTGGQLESEQYRLQAAATLKMQVDSVFKNSRNAKIVIMGDFNDYPDNKSMTNILQAKSEFMNFNNTDLYNLSAFLTKTTTIGSHKFEGEWGILDQIIVSGALLNSSKGLFTSKDNVHVFNADFLLEEDESYAGKKNFRTYVGFQYHGGYSDHLPVFLDLVNTNTMNYETN